MYARNLTPLDYSFFLFGPRGTGKTTWLRSVLPQAIWYDLLNSRELSRLAREPQQLAQEILGLEAKSWIVIDEVQRLPLLLDVVQTLITQRPDCRFALTGSSARRIHREGANLLPGRTLNKKFFPLTAAELGVAFCLDSVLQYGGLPAVQAETDPEIRRGLLEAYVANYIAQEIRLEASVRNLHSFSRFLETAALINGQVTNVSALSRDAAVARTTVQGYFEILTDTLLGTWLPAWKPRARIKQVQHPKFYFFDTGVVRALAGTLHATLHPQERGALLETWILHELRAAIDQQSLGGSLSYWRTRNGKEVDFIWTSGNVAVALECKAVQRWRPEFSRNLNTLLEDRLVTSAFGIYLGDRLLRNGNIEILPLEIFLQRLQEGSLLGAFRAIRP